MALHQIMAMVFFALALARVDLSTCQVLKGSVTCLDCDKDYNFSGIKVVVKCNQVKKFAVTTTGKDGTFKTELPSGTPTATRHGPLNCLARVLGGPDQLYASRKDMVSNVVKAHDSYDSSYTISKPLNFYTSKNSGTDFGSSKTIDLPLPREWGLAPSSYYLNPFIPIIGIP